MSSATSSVCRSPLRFNSPASGQGTRCLISQHVCTPRNPFRVTVKNGYFRRQRGLKHQTARAATASEAPETPVEKKIDVSSNCVKAVYHTQEALQAAEASQQNRTKARILFLSESNVCRSVLAEAFLKRLLSEHGLEDEVECQSKATRDYCTGEEPHDAAKSVAVRLGLELDANKRGEFFDHVADIHKFDLLLACDKFTLADAMREISVYDTVNSSRNLSSRVRHLGEFEQGGGGPSAQDLDIDDPLYGNYGGSETEDAVFDAAIQIEKCCEGLARTLVKLNLQGFETPGNLREQLIEYRSSLADVDWLKPPMLRGR